MIHLQQVQGNVVVDDIKNGYTQQARNGMELDTGGNYLIVTAQNSSVKLSANGQDFSLGASSFIRINGTKTWLDRHMESWSRDSKIFIGKLWARIQHDPRDPGTGNGVVGVRG
jgi:hypothetical protein